MVLAASQLSVAVTADLPITSIEGPPVPQTTMPSAITSMTDATITSMVETTSAAEPGVTGASNSSDEVARLQEKLKTCLATKMPGPVVDSKLFEASKRTDEISQLENELRECTGMSGEPSITIPPIQPLPSTTRPPWCPDCKPMSGKRTQVNIVTLASDDGWSLDLTVPMDDVMGYREHFGNKNVTVISVPKGLQLKEQDTSDDVEATVPSEHGEVHDGEDVEPTIPSEHGEVHDGMASSPVSSVPSEHGEVHNGMASSPISSAVPNTAQVSSVSSETAASTIDEEEPVKRSTSLVKTPTFVNKLAREPSHPAQYLEAASKVEGVKDSFQWTKYVGLASRLGEVKKTTFATSTVAVPTASMD